MRFNPSLKLDIEKYQDYVIIVEGKKDVAALKSLGFQKAYSIHATGVPIRERLTEIISHLDKKYRICILTYFDKKGKQLYLLLKSLLSEQNVRLDSTLRGILMKAGISHIEGLGSFMRKVDYI